MKNLFAVLMALCVAISFAGCDSGKTEDKKDKPAEKKKSGGHAHDHSHGPNGQPMFEMHDLELFGEMIVSKNSNKVGIEFCDHDGKKAVPAKVDKIVIKYADKTYELTAVDAKDGAAVRYEGEGKDLSMVAENRPTLEVTVGDKTATAKLSKH